MLSIVIKDTELFDEEKLEVVKIKGQKLTLEHSLVSISKWESKWCKPYLDKKEKTYEEVVDYIRCMTLEEDINPNIFRALNSIHFKAINDYISAPMSATFFSKERTGPINREPITSELIYFWMVSYQIPFECENWHIARLMTLIRICNLKNQAPKKHSKREIMTRNTALNEMRKQQLGTRG